jgi:hypothetical protein
MRLKVVIVEIEIDALRAWVSQSQLITSASPWLGAARAVDP